jgi:murein DD-endopeptidase MepM/ murein hydrolase activator NlpD
MPRRLPHVLTTGLLLAVLVSGCAGPGAPTAGKTRDSGPAAGSGPAIASAPAEIRRVFPVAGQASYTPAHHDYPATDIFAACGSPVRAPADGTVLEVTRVDRFDPARPVGEDKGGLSVSILGDDGVRYYGSHLATVADGIEAGSRLPAGTQLGVVGRTGNASHVCHLHFGLSPVCRRTGDWWVRRGVIGPAKYLDSWRAGGNLSPLDEVTAWQHDHGCPTAPTPGTR